MHQVLRDAEVIWLAWNAEGAPYMVPVNFIFYEGCIYFHCAPEGRKMDLLRADPRVSFSTALDIAVEKTTTRYRSVCGHGTTTVIEDDAVKNDFLKAFAARFKAPCTFPVSPQKFALTRVLRIDIEEITGKHSHPGEGQRPVPHYER